jgi:hypothetical protein
MFAKVLVADHREYSTRILIQNLWEHYVLFVWVFFWEDSYGRLLNQWDDRKIAYTCLRVVKSDYCWPELGLTRTLYARSRCASLRSAVAFSECYVRTFDYFHKRGKSGGIRDLSLRRSLLLSVVGTRTLPLIRTVYL